MDSKPPISRAKMISITKSAIKAMKVRMVLVFLFMFLTSVLVVVSGFPNLTCLFLSQLYKHVVQIVEKFIRKVSRIIFLITYCTLATW